MIINNKNKIHISLNMENKFTIEKTRNIFSCVCVWLSNKNNAEFKGNSTNLFGKRRKGSETWDEPWHAGGSLLLALTRGVTTGALVAP